MSKAPSRPASSLLIQEPPLQVLPSLAVAVGLNEAIFLQQVHYWLLPSQHIHDGRKWIYNTHDDWHRQLPFWSVRTIRRIIANLEEGTYGPGSKDHSLPPLILTTTAYNELKTDHTKWYTIDYKALQSLDVPEPADDMDRMATSSGQTGLNRVDKMATSSMRQETTKEIKGSNHKNNDSTKPKHPPLTMPQMHALDPVQDRSLILRARFRPEPPPGLSLDNLGVWMELGDEWDRRNRK